MKSLASVSCTQSSLIDDAQHAISRCRADTSRCVAHVSEVIMPILKKIPPELDAAGARAFRTDLDVLSDRVEDLALRITRIRDDDGRLHTLSNGDVIQVCNHSRGPLSATIDIGVAPDTDIHQAISALEPALLEWSVTTGLPEMARVDGIHSADATRVALRIILKTNPGQRPATLTPRLRQICRDALTDAGLRPA